MDLDFILRMVQVAHVHYIDEIWGNDYKFQGPKTLGDPPNRTVDRQVRQILRKYRRSLTPLEQLQWLSWCIWARFRAVVWLGCTALRKSLHILLKSPLQ